LAVIDVSDSKLKYLILIEVLVNQKSICYVCELCIAQHGSDASF